MIDLAIENGQFVINTAYGLIGLAVFLLARMLLKEEESRAAAENLEIRDRKASNALVKITRPFFTQYIVPMVRGKKFWDSQRRHYKRKLVAAGLSDELTSDEFIAFKAFMIVFFPLVGGVLNAGGFLELPLLVVLGSGVAGWFYPDFWMRSRILDRQKRILRAMPFIVDLLALSTEAGLDFVGAIGKVVEKANPSPLVEEFAQFLKEIKVGSSRAEALREMSARIDMTQFNSFAAILISADQMGASIGKILRQQSEQIRQERMVRAEKAGAAAAQKVLLPLVLFILPAVMLMIFGPFLLSFMYPQGAS
ncbi:MAG TPA: type II secretion system F family protein [Bdellovibrionota bacterium]|nr:type II secretion system F family protein [Bdellovibrionota bacterium]